MTTKPRNNVFLYLNHTSKIEEINKLLTENNCNALITPVVFQNFQREFIKEPMLTKHLAFTRSDLVLNSTDWHHKVIAKIANKIDCDSVVDHIRKQSEKILNQELVLASYLSCRTLIRLTGGKMANFAQIVSSFSGLKETIIMECPMVQRVDYYHSDNVSTEEQYDPWSWWNDFRSYTDFDPKIRLALELSNLTPSADEILRWLGEPVEILIIPSNLFVWKETGPLLSWSHKSIVNSFINHNVHMAIQPTVIDSRTQMYANYMWDLIEKFYKSDPMHDLHDKMMTPLQPLYANLDSNTYEVFEDDAIKYQLYQTAIEEALRDRVPDDQVDNVMVSSGELIILIEILFLNLCHFRLLYL